jgi:hypothetical protein
VILPRLSCGHWTAPGNSCTKRPAGANLRFRVHQGQARPTRCLARLLTADEEERTELVQCLLSYAYEDFVEGIRPWVTGSASLAGQGWQAQIELLL